MNDPDEIRTRNLLIRSQTPYPLGHGADKTMRRIILYKSTYHSLPICYKFCLLYSVQCEYV